jgi:hypothetical protein
MKRNVTKIVTTMTSKWLTKGLTLALVLGVTSIGCGVEGDASNNDKVALNGTAEQQSELGNIVDLGSFAYSEIGFGGGGFSKICGEEDQPCCDYGICSSGLWCMNGTCLNYEPVCGGFAQPCCEGDWGFLYCGDGLSCASGTCGLDLCGATGYPCCDGSSCLGDNICQWGTCQSCGDGGEPCCGDGRCNDIHLCQSGTCSSCGNAGEPCCGTDGCNGDNKCLSGTCLPCGYPGTPCCDGGDCIYNDSAECRDGICRSCGYEGDTPCSFGCAPNYYLNADDGKCTSGCGQENWPCCQNDTCGENSGTSRRYTNGICMCRAGDPGSSGGGGTENPNEGYEGQPCEAGNYCHDYLQCQSDGICRVYQPPACAYSVWLGNTVCYDPWGNVNEIERPHIYQVPGCGPDRAAALAMAWANAYSHCYWEIIDEGYGCACSN